MLPLQQEELNGFDVVIFGDVDPNRLTRRFLQLLQSFVNQRGGAIIFQAGERHFPSKYRNVREVTGLLPLALPETGAASQTSAQPFRIEPTSIGLALPPLVLSERPGEAQEVWRNLQPIYWSYAFGAPKPAARVLAIHPQRLLRDGQPVPLIAMQFVGAGRVLLHAFDESWRWRIRLGDKLFARYWLQAIRYLARDKLLRGDRRLEISTDRNVYAQGEVVRVQVRLFGEEAQAATGDRLSALLDSSTGRKRRLTLSRDATHAALYTTSLAGLPSGSYRLVAVAGSNAKRVAAEFSVSPPLGEFERTAVPLPTLQRSAELAPGKLSLWDKPSDCSRPFLSVAKRR